MKAFASFLAFQLSVIFHISLGQIIDIPLNYHSQPEMQQQVDLQSSAHLRNLAKSSLYTESLSNGGRSYYYGSIVLGQNKTQVFSVIFDTTMSISWVPDSSCTSGSSNNQCEGFNHTYNCLEQKYCSNFNTADTLTYRKGSVTGKYVNTTVTIGQFKPIYFPILSANSITDLAKLNVDGVFGLQMYSQENTNKSSIVSTLYANGYISSQVFSLYLGFKQSDSKISFGGYDPSTILKSKSPIYHNVTLNGKQDNTQQWLLSGSQIQLGNYSSGLSPSSIQVLVSSVDPYISFSPDFFNNMIQPLVTYKNVTLSGNKYTVICNQTLPDLLITLPDFNNTNRVYNITPSFYINNNNSVCEIMLRSMGDSSTSKITLGTVFLRKYVSVFSMTNSTIGFADSVAVPYEDHTILDTVVIVIFAVCCSILVLAVIGCFYKRWRMKKESAALDTSTNIQEKLQIELKAEAKRTETERSQQETDCEVTVNSAYLTKVSKQNTD